MLQLIFMLVLFDVELLFSGAKIIITILLLETQIQKL